MVFNSVFKGLTAFNELNPPTQQSILLIRVACFKKLSTLGHLILRTKICKILQITYALIPFSIHIIVQIILFTSLEVREYDKVKIEALLRH